MASPEHVLLPRPPPSPLFLAANLPVRSPDSTSYTTVSNLIRAFISSSPASRQFVIDLFKQLWSDPKRAWSVITRWLGRESRRSRLRLLPIPREVAFPSIDRILAALVRAATPQAIVVAFSTLMAIHVFRAPALAEQHEEEDAEEEDVEDAEDAEEEDAEEDQTEDAEEEDADEDSEEEEDAEEPRGPVPAPRWPPRTWTTDALQELRFDKWCTNMMDSSGRDLHRETKINEGLKRTEQHISSFEADTNSKFVPTHDKFCKNKAAQVENFKGKQENAGVSREESKVLLSLKTIKGVQFYNQSDATHAKLLLCLAALPREEKVNTTQCDSSVSVLRKSSAPCPGRPDKD